MVYTFKTEPTSVGFRFAKNEWVIKSQGSQVKTGVIKSEVMIES